MNYSEILNYFERQAVTGEWNSLYDHKNPASYPFIMRFKKAVELIDSIERNTVLDLGCGTGILIPYVIEKKGNYIGLDNSENMLNIVKEQYTKLITEKSVSLFLGDVKDFIPTINIDVIIGLGFIEYFDKPEIVINQLYEILPKGGKLILSFPNINSLDYFCLKLLAPIRFILRKVTGKGTIAPPRMMCSSSEANNLFRNAGFKNLKKANYNVNFFVYPFTKISLKFTNFFASKLEYSFLSKIGVFSTGFIISVEK